MSKFEEKTQGKMYKGDQKKWEQVRNSLAPKDSTPISYIPLKKTDFHNIIKKILRSKLIASLKRIETVFDEEYILFKEDQFGWLRNEGRLIPLHAGTENIVNLGVGKPGTNTTSISFTSDGYSYIPENILKQYQEKKIPYMDKKSVVAIPIQKIIEFYTKYSLVVPKEILAIQNCFFIDYKETKNGKSWSGFQLLNDSAEICYRYWPATSESISSRNGFAFIISAPIPFKSSQKVMAYALEHFKAPKHPLINSFEYKTYNYLKDLYKENPDIINLFHSYYQLSNFVIDSLEYIINEMTSLDDINAFLDEDVRSIFYNIYIENLCNSDTSRSNIQPYSIDTITDINKGHWEIFESLYSPYEDEYILVPLPESKVIVARDPLADVNYKATCAIDFGTKSTVVVYHEGESVLLRIGATDLWSKPRIDDYENPTVINLINYDRFMKAYKSCEGRPPTSWEDMTVSHQAANAIFSKNIDKDIFYSVFGELKQWANSRSRRQLLNDRTGKKIELKPYTTLNKDDFDPIEIYAYYLGLNINNMHRGICIKYFLSFPVNYSLEVRNRILESFKRGIKKSLPERVLNDETCMKRFKVKAGASEPAAYALSALKAYGVEPVNHEEKDINTYAVFDFGGGTTDFDFGIEYIPDDNSFDYEVKQLGNGGDPLLGGENILNILAYEVYKLNIEEMRKHKITIVRPNDKCSRFAGSEMLVKEIDEADQASYLNLKLLANLLRPIWEETENFESYFEGGKIPCDLYSADEERISPSIKIDIKSLQKVILNHIQDGVDNFMKTFLRTYEGNADTWTWPLHILLAGNSSKSRILQNVLVNTLLKQIKVFDKESRGERDLTDIFRLYPPLGSNFDTNRLEINLDSTLSSEEILSKMLYGYKAPQKKSNKTSSTPNVENNTSRKINNDGHKVKQKVQPPKFDAWKNSRKDL